MVKKPLNVLIIEDSQDDAELMVHKLSSEGFVVKWARVETEADFRAQLKSNPPDVILSDHSMPQFSSARAAELVQEAGLDVPFILVSGSIGEEAAVDAMKRGAVDYLLKDRIARLGTAVERALEKQSLKRAGKKAEEELRATHARLRHLIDHSPGVFYAVKVDGERFVTHVISENIQSLLGYTVDEAMQSEWWVEHLHAGDRDRVLIERARALATGRGTLEYRLRHKDGDYRWLEDKKTIVRGNSGDPVEIIGLVTDITERKRAELHSRAFAHLANRLSSANTALEAGEIIIDVADHLFGWDACTLDIYSQETNRIYHVLNRDLVEGKRQSFTPALDNTPPTPRIQKVLEDGAQLVLREPPFVLEGSVPFGNKSRPSASMMFVPIRHANKVIGILSIQSYKPYAYTKHDLNEFQALADHCGGAFNRIQAERALHEGEERFRQLAENIKEVFWMTDVTKTQMIYVSPAYEQVWGRTREALYQSPKSWLDAIHDDDRERVTRAALSRQATARYDEQYRILRPDGTVRRIRDRAFPVKDAKGEVYRIAGIAEDITERVELEEHVRQAQKLDMIGQLASGVAHDFNNVLAVILGLASVIKETEGIDADTAEAAEQMIQASERGAGLTRQLLSFSRKQVVEPRNLDLNEVITNITKMLKRMLGVDVALEVKCAPSLPAVCADMVMIQQILMNLAVNARDAMSRGGGQLTIETSSVTLDRENPDLPRQSTPGNYVCISVKDTGCGIPDDILPKIFEPFFTTKELGKGTGLGLATVHGIVEQHGGWIKVQTKMGQGTTFRIFFPAVASGRGAATAGPTANGGETILLVEDEAPLRAIVRNILVRHGYRVLEADSGSHAVEIWREHPGKIHLLLTDMMMPGGMTGGELAQKLRAESPDLKVIFNSAYTPEIFGRDFDMKEGVNFLQKPYSMMALVNAMRQMLQK